MNLFASTPPCILGGNETANIASHSLRQTHTADSLRYSHIWLTGTLLHNVGLHLHWVSLHLHMQSPIAIATDTNVTMMQ